MAQVLTDEVDNNWFIRYDMQEIAPDTNYIKRYINYCNKIGLKVMVLLFESKSNDIVIDDKI